jgi:preprotein translocase subunit SecA
MIDDTLDKLVASIAPQGSVPMEWNVEQLSSTMKSMFKIELDDKEISEDPTMTVELLRQKLGDMVASTRNSRIEKYGERLIKYVEKEISLKTLDVAWRNHLVVLEHLRRGINLRAYAQKNPLNEYKFEAFNLFQDMIAQVKKDVLTAAFAFEIDLNELPSLNNTETASSGISEEEQVMPEVAETATSVSRNSPCPCGSGKRYKHCCGALSKPTESALAAAPDVTTSATNVDPAKALHEFIKSQRRAVLSGESTEDDEEA